MHCFRSNVSNAHLYYFLFNINIDMTDWRVPNDLDAAVAWNGSNYFFKGCTVYVYNDQSKRVEWNMGITSAFNAPCYIDTAVNCGNFTYFFKGDKFY